MVKTLGALPPIPLQGGHPLDPNGKMHTHFAMEQEGKTARTIVLAVFIILQLFRFL